MCLINFKAVKWFAKNHFRDCLTSADRTFAIYVVNSVGVSTVDITSASVTLPG